MLQKCLSQSLVLLFILSLHPVLGQTKPAGAATSPLCTKDNALETIRQQVDVSKYVNDAQRIAILIRAADLLWPHQQDKARAAFTDAFEVALSVEADQLDLPRTQSLILRMRDSDQRFVVIRAGKILTRIQNKTGCRGPCTVHILEGLIRLEPDVRKSLPDLLPALTDMREKILVTLSVENQKLFMRPGREAGIEPSRSFAEEIESAQKVSDVDERDGLIASAVLGTRSESLTSVVQAIDMLSDASLRASFFEWLYFQRAYDAAKNKQFEEAERFTAKVEGLEQRAFLHAEIAKGLLSRKDSLVHAREVLEEAISDAKKAGVTIFAARALLASATLALADVCLQQPKRRKVR